MSSRFPPTNNSDPRYSRDRSPPRQLDRRPSASFSDGGLNPRPNEPGYRPSDGYGYQGRGREPPREPPRGPKALLDAPRGGFIPRGRGGFLGRGDARDRDTRDVRDEPFPRRGRGQDWGPRDRFDARDRRLSPAGRDRSRSPLSRDFRDTRDPREFPQRDEPRRDFREGSFSGPPDPFPFRGRGAFRSRGRGDWRGRFPDDRDNLRPRSRSRDRDWEQQIRDDRDHDRDLDSRRDEDLRRERDEREDRLKREPPPFRPASRNSTGAPSTPITSRSTSTTSVHLANLDRYTQNTRDSRESQDQKSRPQGFNPDIRIGSVDRDSEKGDVYPKRAEIDRYESRTASPPPQAPPVPAFGSIPPQRASTSIQGPPPKEELRRDTSPLIHPSRLKLLDPSIEAPSAPKSHILNIAPTGPKAQQATEKWQLNEAPDTLRRVFDNDGDRFGFQRQVFAPPANPAAKEVGFEQVRNISKRFLQGETSPVRSFIPSTPSSSESTQPSIRKAVEEQGRNGNAPSTVGSALHFRPHPGDMSNQSSPIKIPTGPRAERVPASIRQQASSTMRGPSIRGPSMMPTRGGRGGATWSWVNPSRNPPRGPSIMNTVPTRRDSVGEERAKVGPPSTESAESAIEKWRRNNAPSGARSARAETEKHQDTSSSNLSPDTRGKAFSNTAIKVEEPGTGDLKSSLMIQDQENEEDESDEAGAAEGQMDLDEEDFAEAEKKFNRDVQALEAKRPLTPRSNPVLLELLEELDALASALEEKTKMTGSEEPPAAQPVPLGLPSPKPEDGEEMDFKRESGSPSLSVKARPQTPLVENLPFLASGPPTPFSQIESLQEDLQRQDAVEALLSQKLTRQRQIQEAENNEARDTFERLYKLWRESVEAFEDSRRAEDAIGVSVTPDDVTLVAPTPPVVGRRGKIISELDMQEVIRVSQETAAKEERARREREQPVYESAETFNPEREAEVPEMLSREEKDASMFTDTNTLVDREIALQALEFIPKKDDFTFEEHETFLYNYLLYPKRFGIIADALQGRDFRDCVQHYYSTKLSVKYKEHEIAFMKTRKGKKIAASMRGQMRPRSTGLISSFDGMMDYNTQTVALTEKGRPRRAAAPTFGDTVESEPTPAVTPARRGAAGKDNLNGNMSAEKPANKRTKTAPAKEKGGRKGKAPLLAAAPGPSPQKGLIEDVRGLSREPQLEPEQRLEDIEGAQALAGLNAGQLYNTPVYRAGSLEGWSAEQQAAMNVIDPMQKHSQHFLQDQPHPPQAKPGGQPATSSYWSVPEIEDLKNYLSHFGTNWQAIANTMKTKTHTMVCCLPAHSQTEAHHLPLQIKNFYTRETTKKTDNGKQMELNALRADEMLANGQDTGPLPPQTQTGEKRRNFHNLPRESQRPLAPSNVDVIEIDAVSPKVQPTKSQPQGRYKGDHHGPQFTTLASAEQGAAQVSAQMMLQGYQTTENRITISLQKQLHQQVIGPHLGTFTPEDRSRAIFSTRDTVKEKEQREMQARQQSHDAQQERELQRQQERGSHGHHRHRVSQLPNEKPVQSYQQHAPSLIPNALHSSLLGQQPAPAAQASTTSIEVKWEEKARAHFEQQQLREQQQVQQQQTQQQAQQQQQHHHHDVQQRTIQQQQAMQQTPLQQLQQRQPLDTSSVMRRVGSGALSNVPNQLTPSQSPASASLPPMSPQGDMLRPSSVPVSVSAHPPPPPGPPKKSNIMNLLNDATEPAPRKRLSDQRPAAPTPPPQQSAYQPATQSIQQIQRRETPSEPLMQMQQQQRPAFPQQNHHQQQTTPAAELGRNWAAAAQQRPQRSWLEDRSAQAQSVPSPPPQPPLIPSSSRNSMHALQQRTHVPSPPPFSHSRTSSYTQHQQSQPHHHQQQPSGPAEPNIRPSPYASLNPREQSHQHQQQVQQQQVQQHQVQQHNQHVQMAYILGEQQRQARRLEMQQTQHQMQREQEEARRRQDVERQQEQFMRERAERREMEERDRRAQLGGQYYTSGGGDGHGVQGRGLGGGYEERR